MNYLLFFQFLKVESAREQLILYPDDNLFLFVDFIVYRPKKSKKSSVLTSSYFYLSCRFYRLPRKRTQTKKRKFVFMAIVSVGEVPGMAKVIFQIKIEGQFIYKKGPLLWIWPIFRCEKSSSLLWNFVLFFIEKSLIYICIKISLYFFSCWTSLGIVAVYLYENASNEK